MTKMARTVLHFKLAATDKPMTAQSGVVLHGEFIQGLGVHRWLEQEMPKPGSKRGYGPTQQVLPLLLIDLRWPFSGGPAHDSCGLRPSPPAASGGFAQHGCGG